MNLAGLALLLPLAGALAVGCSSSDSPAAAGGVDAEAPPTVFGGKRPATLRVPAGYDPGKPAPLVMLLHGYGTSGKFEDIYMHVSSIADQEGFFFIAPDGMPDSTDARFWNVAPFWCPASGPPVDDVAYLGTLIDDIEAAYAIDPKRVFLVGHSNGGSMAEAMACAHAERFAALASLAGPLGKDPALCTPTVPVGVLHIAGTADTTIDFAGGSRQLPGTTAPCEFAGAVDTVAMWAAKNGCGSTPAESAEPIDVESTLPGAETRVSSYPGCPANGAAELWTIQGGTHIPDLVPGFPAMVWGFLSAHAKP